MAAASLKMDTPEAEKVIMKIMYRKRQADKDAIEESFRRSVDSAGLSVNKTLTSALNKLTSNGNLKMDKRNGKFKFVTARGV
jgi:predicted transcriptional regulator